MLYAVKDGDKRAATPGDRGTCPGCGGPVLAKCGEVLRWHWAHIADAQCDPWLHGETDWHLGWKRLVPPAWCEVTMRRDGLWHRADIRRPDGLVVELQHSPISPKEVREREEFYGEMIWLLDARDRRWKLDDFSRPVFLDLGGIVWEPASLPDKMLAEDFHRKYLTGPRPRRPGEDYKKWLRRNPRLVRSRSVQSKFAFEGSGLVGSVAGA